MSSAASFAALVSEEPMAAAAAAAGQIWTLWAASKGRSWSEAAVVNEVDSAVGKNSVEVG